MLSRNGDEIIEFTLAIDITADDAYNIIRVLLNHIGVEIGQRNTRPLGVFFCGANTMIFCILSVL